MKLILNKKRRGVSEVISTVLILSITMVGAVFVAALVNNSAFTATDQTPRDDIRPNTLRLTAYDTRDSLDLSGIANLDNHFNQILCTSICNGTPNNVPGPVNGGTEFIVLQVRNLNINPVFLHAIYVNDVEHLWDENTSGKILDASIDDLTGKYPLNGKFSIIPISNSVPLTQQSTIAVPGDDEVRIIIKLNSSIANDLEMWRPLKIIVNYGAAEPTEYIILSGDAR